ncbi:ribosome biogenesis GTP-binding protein YihA/YsxC [Parapedobacter lycopersici]|uniref:ribosome biogenesis GTP-binding protein YihA/YsxC n=1 Tax=Parapedobacter lycopersici TaxID=1864939 RepID=UPI00214DA208|nr:ribosome biogenesis GTP-binding protein YihA/YsxC [Parapedobacter lycopersici]
MLIKTAVFICSNTRVDQLPKPSLPEYAFIGRSNVGKSSLINALTGKRSLAKTSQTPGKTQVINHFLINDDWYLVDLPGYGFAKTSKSNRAAWEKFIRRYLLMRENLQCVFVLVDSRHGPQQIDLDFCCWLGGQRIPFMLVFTKADKLSQAGSAANIKKFRQALLQWFETVPPHFLTSAETRMGGEPLLMAIDEINRNFNEQQINALDNDL